MSSVTTLILIGHAHPNMGGIRSFAEITLEEGDRPGLLLRWNAPRGKTDPESFRKFTMIPTIENMLDDAVLMIAYAVCRHPKIFEKVNRITKGVPLDSNYLTMYDDFTLEQRAELYADVKAIDDLPMVTWCLFEGSAINDSMPNLKNYLFESEVTRSVYKREYNHFTSKWNLLGKL
jgi:hypothetical protein